MRAARYGLLGENGSGKVRRRLSAAFGALLMHALADYFLAIFGRTRY